MKIRDKHERAGTKQRLLAIKFVRDLESLKTSFDGTPENRAPSGLYATISINVLVSIHLFSIASLSL